PVRLRRLPLQHGRTRRRVRAHRPRRRPRLRCELAHLALVLARQLPDRVRRRREPEPGHNGLMVAPSLAVETELHATGARWVIGCDEVGRGAIAGPVAVGVSAVSADTGPIPDGLRDSKLLSEPRREALEPLARAWVHASAVGFASAEEIDRIGIISAL